VFALTEPGIPGGGEHAGRVEIDVVPNAQGFERSLKRQVDPAADEAGRELGKRIAAPVGKQIAAAVTGGVKTGGKQARPQAERLGRDIGGSVADRFGTALTAGVTKVIKGLPAVELKADSSNAEKAAANIRRELLTLTGKRIDVDISSEEALERVASLRRQLSALTRQMEKLKVTQPDIEVDVDALGAMAEITALQTALKKLTADPAQVRVEPEFNEGAFSAKLKAAVAHAAAQLPDVPVGADVDPARRALAGVRQELLALSGVRVGVDMDAAAFHAQAAAVTARLRELQAGSVDVAVDVDIGAALGKLTAFEAMAAAAGKDRTVNIDADTGAATAGMAGLAVASKAAANGAREVAASLGLADLAATGLGAKIAAIGLGGIAIAALLVPALAAAVVVAGALAVAIGVVVAAVGVLALGLIPIVAAWVAVGKAEKEAGQRAAQHAAQQRSIAQQQRSNAAAVAAARRGVAQAAEQAARDEEAADRRVLDAHRQVIDAVKQLQKAEADLVEAREQARRDQEDLASQIEHNAQDQRQNALDLAAAETELQKIMADPSATATQREQAQLAYDRLTLQNKDLRTQASRLAESEIEAAEKGIEGSDEVVAAKERQSQAEQNLEQRREAHKQAQRERDRALADGAQRVADAQRALAEAQSRQVTSLSATSVAASDAQKALGKLTADSKALVGFLRALNFTPLLKAAQGFAGPLLAGLKSFIPAMMPTITTFVANVSAGIGDAIKVLLEAFQSPFWKDFFATLGNFAKGALPGFAKAIEAGARAVAGLIEAFMPAAGVVGGGALRMLEDFADWAAGLKDNPEFQAFVAYALEQLPKLWELLKSVTGFLINLGKALAPVGGIVLDALTAVFKWLAGIDPDTLTKIIVAVAGVAAAFLAWQGIAAVIGAVGAVIKVVRIAIGVISGIASVASAAIGTFGLATVGVVLAVVAVIAGLVAAFVWLYNNNETFRAAVLNVWNAIKEAVATAWNDYLKPALTALWQLILETVVPVLLSLWHDVIVPAFAAITAAIGLAWKLIKPVLMLLWWIIKTIVIPIIVFLWKNVVAPAFKGISFAIQVAFKIINVVFTLIRIIIEGVLIPAFKKIWGVVLWVWDKVKPFFVWLGEVVEKYVIPPFKKGVEMLGKAFDKIRDFFKAPIKFVIETVLNDGIIDGVNWLAKALHVPNVDIKRIPLPAGFAAGGAVRGPGTRTSDSIIARLSDDEHVWTAAEVAAAGGHDAVMRLRKLALTGMLKQRAGYAAGGPVNAQPQPAADGLPGYQLGGIVKKGWGAIGDAINWASEGVKGAAKLVGDFTGKAMSVIGDPGRAIKDLVDKLVGLIPDQDTILGKIMVGIPRQALKFVETKVDDFRRAIFGGNNEVPWTGTLSPDPLIKRMQEFALAQRGKIYGWATQGPTTFDCSGLTSNLYAIATGNRLNTRYMSTADMGPGRHGMVAGPGRWTVYLGPGHTASNIEGLHAEAYGGNGTPLAIGRVGTRLSYYHTKLHLPGLATGGRVGDPGRLDDNARLLAFLKFGWPEPPVSFDAGGLLFNTSAMPGQVMPVYHGGSKPDAVLSDQQWRDMHSLAQNAGQRGGAGLHIDNYYERGADPGQVARDLDWISRGLG
jgi:hypothetical protein